MSDVLIVGDTINSAKDYMDRLELDVAKVSAGKYKSDNTVFKLSTIDQIKNNNIKDTFSIALLSKNISLGDFHTYIRPILTGKGNFTVF